LFPRESRGPLPGVLEHAPGALLLSRTFFFRVSQAPARIRSPACQGRPLLTEFTRLLSELSERSNRLNEKTNSLNALIDQFAQKLREMNLGIETWLTSRPISEKPWEEHDEDENVIASGTRDKQLGFARHEKKWQLMVRTVKYKKNEYGGLKPIEEQEEELLEETTRSHSSRSWVKAILAEVDAGLKAIDDAERFVK
jgi:hypothetical protein